MVISSFLNLGLRNFYFQVQIEFLSLKKKRFSQTGRHVFANFNLESCVRTIEQQLGNLKPYNHFLEVRRNTKRRVEMADGSTFQLRTVF